MSRNWKKYNEELIKRGEILIEAQTEQTRKTGRPPLYSDKLILLLLFIKFALRLPYRQTQGLAKKLF